jgi:hypothetical protein
MVIVAGHITVEQQQRESYLAAWVSIAKHACRAQHELQDGPCHDR